MAATAHTRADSTPFVLVPIPDAIPTELRAIPQWVSWRWKYVLDKGKPWTKPPVNPRTGGAASVTDAASWGTFDDALAGMRRFDLPGIGLVLTPDLAIVGGDGDACVDPATGEPDAEARAVLTEAATYAERSPSGTGFRFIARGAVPERIGKGTKRGRYELYRAGRYLTFTGHRFAFAPATIEERTPELAALCDRLFPPRLDGGAVEPPIAPNGGGLSDGDILHKAVAAKNGHAFAALYYTGDTLSHDGDDSRADEALCCHLAFWTRDPAQIDRLFRRSALMREKWERADYRERTIARALATVTELYVRPIAGRGVRVGSVEIVNGKAVQR